MAHIAWAHYLGQLALLSRASERHNVSRFGEDVLNSSRRTSIINWRCASA